MNVNVKYLTECRTKALSNIARPLQIDYESSQLDEYMILKICTSKVKHLLALNLLYTTQESLGVEWGGWAFIYQAPQL